MEVDDRGHRLSAQPRMNQFDGLLAHRSNILLDRAIEIASLIERRQVRIVESDDSDLVAPWCCVERAQSAIGRG